MGCIQKRPAVSQVEYHASPPRVQSQTAPQQLNNERKSPPTTPPFSVFDIPWYHPNTSWQEADALLTEYEVGTFLLRDSTTKPGQFSIWVKTGEPSRETLKHTIHHLIVQSDGKGFCFQRMKFATAAEFAAYIESGKAAGIGVTTGMIVELKYPLPRSVALLDHEAHYPSHPLQEYNGYPEQPFSILPPKLRAYPYPRDTTEFPDRHLYYHLSPEPDSMVSGYDGPLQPNKVEQYETKCRYENPPRYNEDMGTVNLRV